MEGLDEELCCMKCVDPFAAVNPLGNKGAAMRLVSQCCYKLELSCAIICSDQISTPHGDMTHENLPHPLFKVSQKTDVRKFKPPVLVFVTRDSKPLNFCVVSNETIDIDAQS